MTPGASFAGRAQVLGSRQGRVRETPRKRARSQLSEQQNLGHTVRRFHEGCSSWSALMFSGGKVPSVLVCPVCHRNDEDSGGGCGHRSFSHVGGGHPGACTHEGCGLWRWFRPSECSHVLLVQVAHMKVADSGDGFGRRSALMGCLCRLLT